MIDVLYVSMIQGSYLCTQTAASQPIRCSVPGDDLFMYTGKRPEGVKMVSDRMRIVSTTVHPAGSWSRFWEVWRVMLSPLSRDFTAMRGLGTKNTRGAGGNSPRKEIFEGSIFDGMVSFAPKVLKSNSVYCVGRSVPYTPNKPRRKSFGTKAYVNDWFDKGILGRKNGSAGWFKGRYTRFPHKLISGLGSFSQWTLIPHWGYLRRRISGYRAPSLASRQCVP